MGVPEDEDEVPDSYLCERCGPRDHQETLQAMARGEKIWETRNAIYLSEKKRKKGKSAKTGGWLKKDVHPLEGAEMKEETTETIQETGSKRKRGQELKDEAAQPDVKAEQSEDEKPAPASARQDKRRKSAPPPQPDSDTALVDIDKLPTDRQRIATALSKIVIDDIKDRVKSGAYRVPDGHTPQSLGDRYAVRIEYAMFMNHEGPGNPAYGEQFRALLANLKKNKMLLERLLQGTLTADELSMMKSADMASEELQKKNAAMKEQLDRQAVAVEQQGPRYRRTHKGDELIEDLDQQVGDSGGSGAAPVRERASAQDETEMGDAGSPTRVDRAGSPILQAQAPLRVETRRPESMSGGHERRQSSQQFDMNNIWARTAQSPTNTSATAPRPLQMPPRRRSSVPASQQPEGSGTKDDADVDRMLQDDEEETYSPADYTGEDGVVWRGKLVQSADSVSPTVNARFVAGRDITPTVPWKDLLPDKLSIDGRLQIPKAEEYLCSLQWSTSSDVSVLALTPYDDAEGFEAIFTYFKTRQRYAVVHKNKPAMIKDLYIIPVDQGQELPEHVSILEYCRLPARVEERCLLAACVVSRAPDTPQVAQQSPTEGRQSQSGTNGNHSLPQHMRPSIQGPSGSPLNTSSGVFSPSNDLPTAYTGSVPVGGGFPPNPYTQTPPQGTPPQQPHSNPLVNEILGSLQYAPTALQIVSADPGIGREKLVNLRRIMEDDPNARTDINALYSKLLAGGE